jgi:SRSO17 transposase
VRERAANSQIARRLYFQSSSYKLYRQAEKGKRGDKRADKKTKTKLFFPVKRVKSEQRIH